MWNCPQIVEIIYCVYTIPFKMKKVVINQDKTFQKCAKDYFHHVYQFDPPLLGPFPPHIVPLIIYVVVKDLKNVFLVLFVKTELSCHYLFM